MYKIKKIVLSVLCGILTLSCFTSSAFADSSVKDNQNQSSSVIASVNGDDISYSYFTNRLHIDEISNSNSDSVATNMLNVETSDTTASKKLLQEMIMNQIVAQNAKNLGITVSRQEAEDEVNKTHSLILDQIKNGTPEEKAQVEESWNNYQNLLKNLGMTEKQYIEEYEISAMQTILLDNKHYQKFVEQNIPKNTPHDTIVQLYKNYLDDLMDKSNIVINDTSLQ